MRKMSRNRILTETFLMYGGFVVLGISESIVGPTLLDLQELTHSTTEQISFVFGIKSLVGVATGFSMAFIINKCDPWMLMATSICFSGVTYVLTPLCTNLISFGIVRTSFAVVGLIFNATGNSWLLKIWGKDNDPWMQALHFLFGLGSAIGPLIAAPFLSSYHNDTTISYHSKAILTKLNYTDDKVTFPNSTVDENSQFDTQIKFAYFIVAGLFFVHGLVYFILFFTSGHWKCGNQHVEENGSEESKTSEKEDDNPDEIDEKTNFKSPFLISFVSLMFIFYWMYVLVEQTFPIYLTAYTVEELHWTQQSGATLTTGFWVTFTVSRGIGIFTAKVVKPVITLIVLSIVSILSLVPMVLFSPLQDFGMWTCSILLGCGLSPMFASGLSYSDIYVPMSGGLSSIYLGAGYLASAGPFLMVPLLGTYGWNAFIVLLIVSAIIMFLAFVVSLVIGEKYGKRNRLMMNEKSPLIFVKQ